MEKTFRFNLLKILNEVNGEPDLIPYWIKLDLLDRGVPIEIDTLDIKDDYFNVNNGTLSYVEKDNILEVKWITDYSI